jgi:NADPH-dependent 2,4-dienoyl-CoA reductase/sulfur reductase-like enzyme
MFAARGVTGRRLLAVAAGLTASSITVASCAGPTPKDSKNQKVVIVGGGTAGIGVAAMLRNKGMKSVVVVEPSDKHYYQPLWTLVGAGIKDNKDSVKPMADVIPSGVTWVNKAVQTFQPDQNQITLADGSTVDYDYLVVAAGMQLDWNKIPGLVEGLKKPDSGVVSMYDFNYSKKTWDSFRAIAKEAKRMLFTMPTTLIKCAGAPQKIMWLLEDELRTMGLRDRVSVEFWVPGAAMFGIKYYSDQLEQIRKDRGVKASFRQDLVSLDVEKKVATFKALDTNTLTEQSYDFIHVTPPMSAPDFIKTSPLSNQDGWVEVDKNTLQSTKFPNIFGIGDCTNTPNSKTAAAVISQSSVLVHNLNAVIENKPMDGYYRGYASCPLIIKKGRVILAEFGYGGKLMESFHPDTGKFPLSLLPTGDISQAFFYFLKEQVFPVAYWTMWVRGNWHGANGPFWPDVTIRDDDPTPPAGKK